MRSLATVVATSVLVAVSWISIDACGDKFLLVGRGVSVGRTYASLYPGRIVIYMRQNAEAVERTDGLRKLLTRAGHQVSVATGDQLQTLQPGHTDIVISDGADAGAVDAQLTGLTSKPTVLFVLMNKDKRSSAATKTVCQLKQSDKADRFLTVIEDAMKARQQSGTRVKRG
jgi:hypothetical protein